MDLGLLIVSQDGVTWDDWCALAEACERFGVSTMLSGDHYISRNDEPNNVAHDAWTILAALAARTHTLRLGTLVSPITFRSPAVLANIAATVDHVSGGRIELGLGSGWLRREHEAFGFPFPPLRERQKMFAEQIEIVHRLWTQDRVTFHGSHYQLNDAMGMPKPLSNPPRIVVGGAGKVETAIPAARFATEYNTEWREHPREFETIRGRVLESCRAVDRDPATMRFSIAIHCIIGDSRDDVVTRAHDVYQMRQHEEPFDDWFAEASRTRLVGTVPEIATELRHYRDAGADRVILIHNNHRDLDSIETIGRRLIPLLRE